jgi:hypothetical protein
MKNQSSLLQFLWNSQMLIDIMQRSALIFNHNGKKLWKVWVEIHYVYKPSMAVLNLFSRHSHLLANIFFKYSYTELYKNLISCGHWY